MFSEKLQEFPLQRSQSNFYEATSSAPWGGAHNQQQAAPPQRQPNSNGELNLLASHISGTAQHYGTSHHSTASGAPPHGTSPSLHSLEKGGPKDILPLI
jgi:hypothetical protein